MTTPNVLAYTGAKTLPPAPEIAELTTEERDAWLWITGEGFDTHLINLSPRLARLLMERIGENRKPKRATIQRYAAMMRSGQWKLTHQGIAISTRSEVIDGQHRILAVYESGVTIEVLMVRGVSQDAMLVLDSGIIRTDADSIRIADYVLRDLETIEVSTAKRMIRSVRQFIRPVSRADLRAFILLHRSAIQVAYRALWQEGRVPNVSHADVVAVLARASYHCPRPDLLAAAKFLADGKSDSNRYEPLRVLREQLIRAHRRDLNVRYGKTERAMRAFVDNDSAPFTKRLTEAREELFPLPEEDAKTNQE